MREKYRVARRELPPTPGYLPNRLAIPGIRKWLGAADILGWSVRRPAQKRFASDTVFMDVPAKGVGGAGSAQQRDKGLDPDLSTEQGDEYAAWAHEQNEGVAQMSDQALGEIAETYRGFIQAESA